jgi:DNA integrity scanning protein DisA with diadenylate cyclase activity
MKEVSTLHTPTFRDVIVENPLFDKTEEIRRELEKMPEKNREEYLSKNVEDVWNKVKVVKVSKIIKETGEIKEGSLVFVDPSRVLEVGIPLQKGKYVQISETLIKGIW